MGHLGVVLYECLGEEYPEVLGSILGGLKAIVNVIGMTKMTPPIKDLLPRLTPILKNRHEKVQENCIDLVGRIADRGHEFVSARYRFLSPLLSALVSSSLFSSLVSPLGSGCESALISSSSWCAPVAPAHLPSVMLTLVCLCRKRIRRAFDVRPSTRLATLPRRLAHTMCSRRCSTTCACRSVRIASARRLQLRLWRRRASPTRCCLRS